MTKSDTWSKANDLYQAALNQEESRRADFLEEACGGDETLLREVLSLLSGVRRVELSDPPSAEGVSPEIAPDPVSWTASRSGETPSVEGASSLGRQLAHYEIVRRIGAGGMGEVFRARDLRLGRDVAIKLMHAGFSSKPDRLRRFEREARAAAALNHPNIATIYEVGEHEGTRFISMELVDGRTLRDQLSGARGGAQLLAGRVAGGLHVERRQPVQPGYLRQGDRLRAATSTDLRSRAGRQPRVVARRPPDRLSP